MTVVVGCVEKEVVWMGADSAGSQGWEIVIREDPKIFRKGEFLIGFTDSYRMGQILRYSLEIPAIPEGCELFDYMCLHFIHSVRGCLKGGGFARKENEAESGGTFMVGVRGRLFTVYQDYQVGENKMTYAAIGCGRELALGAMCSLGNLPEKIRPRIKQRITMALLAAEQWSSGVRGPFLIHSDAEKPKESE